MDITDSSGNVYWYDIGAFYYPPNDTPDQLVQWWASQANSEGTDPLEFIRWDGSNEPLLGNPASPNFCPDNEGS
jgi:hypothetical protein